MPQVMYGTTGGLKNIVCVQCSKIICVQSTEGNKEMVLPMHQYEYSKPIHCMVHITVGYCIGSWLFHNVWSFCIHPPPCTVGLATAYSVVPYTLCLSFLTSYVLPLSILPPPNLCISAVLFLTYMYAPPLPPHLYHQYICSY